jgi:two-component system response regulator FixJ
MNASDPINPPLPPTIFVVDDDAVMCAMVRKLGETMGLAVTTYPSAEGFLKDFKNQPGCLVTDIHLGGMSGLELQQELLKRGATLPIIVITGKGEVQMAVRAMQNQAVDFLEKPFDIAALGQRIRQAIDLDTNRRAKATQKSDAVERLSRLTPREREVMQFVVQGMSNKQMAAKLSLSEKTIEVHRGNVMRKTAADSVAELVRLSLNSGETEKPA